MTGPTWPEEGAPAPAEKPPLGKLASPTGIAAYDLMIACQTWLNAPHDREPEFYDQLVRDIRDKADRCLGGASCPRL